MGSTDLMSEKELPDDVAKRDGEVLLKSLAQVDENDDNHELKSTLQVYPQQQQQQKLLQQQHHQQQQQSQGSVVCWERFLHVRTIRVLLVENDDATRIVVSALLRNCNYEVLEAAHGVQAWKILEDLNNHIDIVLTEVDMPCVSGVSLLCKIMSHKTRKNIPVIMMSTLDSMGLVFRCLSKGAVDFLNKPIRKNELKNLWQHVWRRCHSSSGSGSESGTQTQKSVKSKCSEKSGSSASDDGRNDVSNGLNVGDGSDEGSGAQSSWTKQAVEVDSPRGLSPMDQVAECQDSTCAIFIRSNAEHSDNKRVPISVAREGHEENQLGKGKDMESSVERKIELKSENLVEAEANHAAKECESSREVTTKKLENSNDSADEHKEPNLELSLKRHREVKDIGESVQDERCVVRRSEQSAFSRYNNASTSIFKATNVSGSNSVPENSTEVAKREHQGSNGVSNNLDMGSTMNKVEDKFEATSAMNIAYPSARYGQQQFGLLTKDSQSTLNQMTSNHFHGIDNQPSSNHDESSLKKLAAEVPHCGSTNVLGGPTEENLRNYSLNRSNSGSNHGSNGQNGSSTVINTVGNNAESDVGKSGSGDASGNRVDESKTAQREAALLKFRQKRKERCFQKRVRYQNRKRLAEQRPRVRGQFVKQTGTDGSGGNEDE